MRPATKILFGTFAACAVVQGTAQAQPDPQQPAQPQPDAPGQPLPDPSAPDADPQPPPSADSPPMSSPDTPPVANPDVDPMTDSPAYGDAPTTSPFDYAWFDRRMRSGIGVSAIVGGGVTGFTDKTMRDATSSVGGLWDLRVTIGSHIPVALDLSYLGSATSIDGLPGGQSATLIGTTAEAALRYNVMPHYMWTPYVFAGAGWQRYDVTQASGPLVTGMRDHDDLLEFPLGAGVAYRRAGFVGDLRGTVRVATEENLLAMPDASGDFAPMHTWEASAALGYEF